MAEPYHSLWYTLLGSELPNHRNNQVLLFLSMKEFQLGLGT